MTGGAVRSAATWLAGLAMTAALTAQARPARHAVPASTHAAQSRAALARAAEARAAADRLAALIQERRLETARTDLRLRAFAPAARAYQAVLELDPDNAQARAGLALARYGDCREQAWNHVAADEMRAAAATLSSCQAWQVAAEAPSVADEIADLRQMATIEAALDRHDGAAAAAALAGWPSATLPPALEPTLAPAYARYASGDARGAATAAMAAVKLRPALAARGAAFASFLRGRERLHLLRSVAVPSLAAYALALLASLWFGLRRLAGDPLAQPPAEVSDEVAPA